MTWKYNDASILNTYNLILITLKEHVEKNSDHNSPFRSRKDIHHKVFNGEVACAYIFSFSSYQGAKGK